MITIMIPDCRVTGGFQKLTPFPLSIGRKFSLPLNEQSITNITEVAIIIEQVQRDVGLWDEVRDRLADACHQGKSVCVSVSAGRCGGLHQGRDRLNFNCRFVGKNTYFPDQL
ncbi:MAG: hypothetical protein IT528_07585 [Nitrosomonas sp.]|nr:hypothetical protein [Nitrosomonas sp.]